MKKDIKKSVLSLEVAVSETVKFLKKHNAKEIRRGKLKLEDVEEDYIEIIEALQDGFLTFDDKSRPTYKLREPMEVESGDKDLGVYEISFRNRIKPSQKAEVMDGLEVHKQLGKFSLRYMAFMTQIGVKELDNLDADDYDTINQICSVF